MVTAKPMPESVSSVCEELDADNDTLSNKAVKIIRALWHDNCDMAVALMDIENRALRTLDEAASVVHLDDNKTEQHTGG